ncbi:MAG: alpha-amylase family glycosyl hydrolase [Candidatus Limnocylindrales bacterium]
MPSHSRFTAVVAAVVLCLIVASCGGTPPSPAPPSASAEAAPSPGASPLTGAPRCPDPVVPKPNEDWWRDRVFYEVFVRSFADSDGDGIGDLQGLTDRLDYLNDGDPATTTDLGVTGLWLMPIAEAASYHGYDVVDYRAIEHDYGTTDEFRALVAEAHRRGIAVIVDLVLNHTSREHPWFQDSRQPGSAHADWYRWSDTDPGYGGPDGQPVWHPDGERFYYAQFWEGMPDLDLANPRVTAELDGVARYWLDDLDVDGFRLDAIKHLVEDGEQQEDTRATHAWLEGFNARVHSAKPDALLVGEVYDLTLVSSSYVPAAVDLAFDFELAGKMLLGARIGEAASLASAQRDVLERYRDRRYAAFLTNHDQARVMTELNDPGTARAAATALLTNPGVPFVYYGEEIGLTGGKPDERIRAPMPWDGSGPGAGFTTGVPWEPFEPGRETHNVAAATADPHSLLAHYRALIAARTAHPALSAGTFVPLESSAPTVYAFLATRGSDQVVVIVNLGSVEVAGFALSASSAGACSAWPATDATVVYADGLPATATVTPPAVDARGTFDAWRPVPAIPAHATLVISLSP